MKFQPPASVEFKAPPLILVVDLFDPRVPSSLVGVVTPPTNAFGGERPHAIIAAPRQRRKVMVLREMTIECCLMEVRRLAIRDARQLFLASLVSWPRRRPRDPVTELLPLSRG